MGIYEDDADEVVSPNCRICDYNPCMCGANKLQSDKEVREEAEADARYWEGRGPTGD